MQEKPIEPMKEEAKKRCYKCLLRDMDKNEYFQNLHDYIENLDEEIKASAELYNERLEVCQSCNNLLEGMCRACGCFVELRAAIEKNICPYNRW